jgi:hypothetical protein
MFQLLMISIVALPAAIGAFAGAGRERRRALLMMLAALLVYDMLYLLMLHYLRFRWSGG